MESPDPLYHRENPDQGSFRDGFGPVPTVPDIPPMAEVTTDLTEVDRARLLLEALHFAGQERRNEGLLQATQPDSQHRSGIEGRYPKEFPTIIEQSADTQSAAAHSAPRLFYRAMGFDEAVKDGSMTPQEAKLQYDRFIWKFFIGPNAVNNRTSERTRLKNITNPPKTDATDGSA